MTPSRAKRPLLGTTVVVTRSRAQAAELSERLERLGAEVLEFPVIEIVDPETWEPADEAIRALETYDWVVFTSANAVDRFFARMAAHDKDARQMAGCRVAAVGPATAARCEEHGIRPDYVPDEHRAEGILGGFMARGVGEGSRILVPRALRAREVLPDTLRERGAHVDVVPVYQTVLGVRSPDVEDRFIEGTVDVVTFTSSSTVRNFLRLLEGVDVDLGRVTLASIGPVTSQTISAAGLAVGVEAADPTVASLADSIAAAVVHSRPRGHDDSPR